MKKQLALILGFTFVLIAASCTVQKRVHRKGWHIEWKRNYKQDRATVENEKLKDLDSNDGSNNSASSKKNSKSLETHFELGQETQENAEYSKELSSESANSTGDQLLDDPQESTNLPSSKQKETNTTKQKKAVEKTGIPRPAVPAIALLSLLFALLLIILLAGGFAPDLLVLLLAMAWVGVVLGIIMRHYSGNSGKDDVPYRKGVYNLLMLIGILAIIAGYMAILGALSSTLGLIIFFVLLLLIALSIFLIKTLKNKGVENDTQSKEEERLDALMKEIREPEDNLSPEEKEAKKKKTTTGLLIFCGVIVAAVLALILIL